MILHKLKLTVLTLLLLGFIASGVGLLGRSSAMMKDEPKPSSAGVRSGQASRDKGATPSADPNRIIITGRVLTADGRPVSGARVAVVARPQPQNRDPRERDRNEVLGSARADAEGRFRVDLPRITPDPDYVALVVGASGWALAGKDLDSGLPSEDQTITLESERIYRGRFIDLQGQPIRGVRVRVEPVSNASL